VLVEGNTALVGPDLHRWAAQLPDDGLDLHLPWESQSLHQLGAPVREELARISVAASRGAPVLLRGLGSDRRLLYALALALGARLYYCRRLGICDSFEVEPFTDSLSESIQAGGFHTDFSAQDSPPDFVILQCVNTDPRHPHFGRNQIVRIQDLLDRIHGAFGPDAIAKMYELTLPHRFGDVTRQVKLLDLRNDSITIKIHTRLVADDLLPESAYIGDVAIHRAISLAALDVAIDLALGAGDAVLFSNRTCLHRRGECTMTYDTGQHRWVGRRINSVRLVGELRP
jgi:hypothetical protein